MFFHLVFLNKNKIKKLIYTYDKKNYEQCKLINNENFIYNK